MDLRRITRHLRMTHGRVAETFPAATLDAIEEAIRASEARHAGQIRFLIEGALDLAPLLKDQTPRDRAIDVFSTLRIWDTEHNNGVLIYVLLADHAVEVIADRGIDAKVGPTEWEAICHTIEAAFGRGDYETGVVGGINAITRRLVEHFPRQGAGPNELPDKPVVW